MSAPWPDSAEDQVLSKLEAIAASQSRSEERALSRLEALAASQGRIESSLAKVSCLLDGSAATLAAVAASVSMAAATLEGRAADKAGAVSKTVSKTGSKSEADSEDGIATQAPESPCGSFRRGSPQRSPLRSRSFLGSGAGALELAGGTPVTWEAPPRSRSNLGAGLCGGGVGSPRAPGVMERVDSDSPGAMGATLSTAGYIAWALPAGWPSSIALRDTLEAADRVGGSSTALDCSCFRPTASVQSSSTAVAAMMLGGRVPQGGDRRFSAISPNSNLRLAVGLVSLLALVYDGCVVPFVLGWDIPVVGTLWATAVGTTCFWTLDLLLSLVSGYHRSSGIVVTDLRRAALHYLTTWFLPDLLVLTCDWLSIAFVAVENDEASTRGLRMLRFTKVGRLLRVVGMLRMVKFAVVIEEQLEKRLDDAHRFLLKVTGIFCFILWTNHLLACAFFAIGRSAPSNTGMRWVDNVDVRGDGSVELMDAGFLYQYMLSLHWSIAQTTLGSMEVSATNTIERVYTIGMMLLGLVFGCTLVSSLSGAMLEFRMLRKERQDTFRTLHLYLRANRVGYELAQLVQRQAAERFGRKVHLAASGVRALNFVSASLRAELHFEICQPYIVRHPLLRLWANADAPMCRRFCFDCVMFLFPVPGDDVFLPGAAAECCYHVISGSLTYNQEPGSSQVLASTVTPVAEGRWLCEAALWSQWIHVGRLEAETECQLLAVQPQELGQVLRRNRILRDITMEYSKQFHQRIISARPPRSQWPDDLRVPYTEYGDLVGSASADVRAYIGLCALEEHAAAMPWGWQRGFAAGPGLEKLRTEVQEGRSVVTVNGHGDAERIVIVVALRLTREEDGHVFALLAKQEGLGATVVPCCRLPGKKQEHGALAGDALQGILRHIGLTEADIEVENVLRETEWKESREYGVRTKYLRTVCHAQLRGVFPDDDGAEADRMDLTRGASQWSVASKSQQKIDITMRCGSDTTHFYAWLAPAALEELQTSAGEARLRDMLSKVGGGAGGHRRGSTSSDHSSDTGRAAIWAACQYV